MLFLCIRFTFDWKSIHRNHCSIEGRASCNAPPLSIILLLGTEMGLLFEPCLEIMQSDGVDHCSQVTTAWGTQQIKRVESILDFQLICHFMGVGTGPAGPAAAGPIFS